MRFTASRWFTDPIYPFKRFAFLLLFPKTEYSLLPFKKMRCFDKKQSILAKLCSVQATKLHTQFSQFSFIQFHLRDSRFFYALFCCYIVLFYYKVAFLLFFLMTFSVSTVHFSEFILFGGKQIILHSCRSLAIDSTLDANTFAR